MLWGVARLRLMTHLENNMKNELELNIGQLDCLLRLAAIALDHSHDLSLDQYFTEDVQYKMGILINKLRREYELE